MRPIYTEHNILRLSDFKGGKKSFGSGQSEPKECIELCLNCDKPKCHPNACEKYKQFRKNLKSEVSK